ncbi:unnamed protein product [Phaeothamnion confervicola]
MHPLHSPGQIMQFRAFSSAFVRNGGLVRLRPGSERISASLACPNRVENQRRVHADAAGGSRRATGRGPKPPPIAGGALTAAAATTATAGLSPATGRIGVAGAIAQAKMYLELSKYRLSALVVFTTSSGYLAAGGPVDLKSFIGVCAGTALAAASASTFNQVIEKQSDFSMKRTVGRPLPSARVSPAHAASWGVATGAASLAVLSACTNPLTTALGMGNIFLYAVPYTLSKTRTEANTWIGSLVGAIPPVMGWVAATGEVMALEPLLLGGYLFLWQFPHFFALSYMYRQDYARGGFKMVPCNDPTGGRTAGLISRYAMYMMPLPLAASALGATSWMFAVEGTAMNALLLHRAYKFHDDRSNANAREVFKASLWHLPAVLALFVFHSKNWERQKVTGAGAEAEVEGSWLAAAIAGVKRRLRTVCVHERVAAEDKAGAFCPAVVTEEAAEAVRDAATLQASQPLLSAEHRQS